MYIPIAFGGKSWAKRWFSQNVGSLQVPWVSIYVYLILSLLIPQLWNRLQPPTSYTQRKVSCGPRVKWALGTFAGKAFAHLLISKVPMAMVLKTVKNIRESPDAVAAQHTIFFSLGVRRASTWRFQQKKPANFIKFLGHSFLMQKSKPKTWWATDFFQLMEATKSTNPLRIGLRLSNQPVFGESCWLCMIMLYYLLLVHCARARDTWNNVQALDMTYSLAQLLKARGSLNNN